MAAVAPLQLSGDADCKVGSVSWPCRPINIALVIAMFVRCNESIELDATAKGCCYE